MSGASGSALSHDSRCALAAWRTARWLALAAGACLMAACAVPPSQPGPAAPSPVQRVPSTSPTAASSRVPSASAVPEPAAAPSAPASSAGGGRAQRAAELPPVSTVVPSVAPAGVPGPGGLYSLDDDKSTEGLRADPDQKGMASWYGSRFHRRRTASGERFDMYALTAAHPTLPFGTRVCVHSMATGRTVQVRINDRGPHSRGRIIDLSQAAAKRLGMLGLGTKQVTITALADEDGACPDQDEEADGDQ